MVFVYFKTENDENYICKECKFETPNQNTMHYHYKSHQEKTNKCKDCDKKFSCKSALDLHILSKHKAPTELYHCTSCKFSNLTKGNCRIHWTRMHCKEKISKILEEKESGLFCKGCSSDFKGLTSFYYHAYDCLKLDDTYCRLVKTSA